MLLSLNQLRKHKISYLIELRQLGTKLVLQSRRRRSKKELKKKKLYLRLRELEYKRLLVDKIKKREEVI